MIHGGDTPEQDVLFPYARQHFQAFLETVGLEDADVKALAALHCEQCPETPTSLAILLDYAQDLMAADSKQTELKQIQGRIWASAYKSGKIQGQYV